MLQLYVVDRSAESRNRVVERIHSFLEAAIKDIEVMPRVQVKPLSLEEVRFHGAPDICVLGPGVADQEITDIGKLKKIYPDAALLVCTTHRLENLASIEQIARQGADDTLSERATASEFLHKLVLLSRRVSAHATSTMVVVDSGKGGVGVTSTVAALGEYLSSQGKKTVVVDLDFESQDLTRFLQVRPFVNENLQYLLDGSRPITAEFVEQSVIQVWEDDENLFCLPPIPDGEIFINRSSNAVRSFVSIFQFLDEAFDCIVIDLAGVRGPLQKAVNRLSDTSLFVLSSDPAALYASAARIGALRDSLSHGAEIVVADLSTQFGLSRSLLKEEFCRAGRIEPSVFTPAAIPFSKEVCRWPGSGQTPLSLAKSDYCVAVEELAGKLFPELAPKESKVSNIYGAVSRVASKLTPSKLKIQKKEEATPLPAAAPRLRLPTPAKHNQQEQKEQPPLYVTKSQGKPSAVTPNKITETSAEGSQKEEEFDDLISGASLH